MYNNPLIYNDPSGEFIFTALAAWLGSKLLAAAVIGAAIGVASYTVGLAVTGNINQWSLGGALKSAFWGAVGGAVSFGVGEIFNVASQAGKLTQIGTLIQKSVGDVGLAMVQAGTHAVGQGVLSVMQGGSFEQAFWSGALGSLGASAFGAISGGIGAELSGGNFWEGALIGGVVAGLNHAMHRMDNGYDKNGNKINNNGGDKTDYLYDENGKIIASTNVKITYSQGGEVNSQFGGYGFRHYTFGTGGALYDPSFDIFTSMIGWGEIKAGFFMIKNGVTLLSKKALGYKVLGEASKHTLKSSVAAKKIYGSKTINLFNGRVKSLPYLSPYKVGRATYWSTFYGRNSAVFGLGRVGIGGSLIYQTNKNK